MSNQNQGSRISNISAHLDFSRFKVFQQHHWQTPANYRIRETWRRGVKAFEAPPLALFLRFVVFEWRIMILRTVI